jgi:hypothetical protein
VKCEHFYGVSPRRYREIFERSRRKDDDGTFQNYVDGQAAPILDIRYPFYNQLEVHFMKAALTDLLKIVDEGALSEA